MNYPPLTPFAPQQAAGYPVVKTQRTKDRCKQRGIKPITVSTQVDLDN